jgi:hypothetical protein
MSFKLHAALFTVGLMSFVYCVTPAVADEWDKMTTFHFTQPVEVPGHVLIPGTYVFKLADLSSDRDVVEIFSQDQRGMDHLVTTVLAIPAYEVRTPDRPMITFEERHVNTPEAVHTWYYPGDNYGWEFAYPKGQTLQVAANTPPPPAATPAPAPAPAPAPVAAAPQPAPPAPQETVVIAQNQGPAPAPAPSVTTPAPQELPKTASDFPLTALLGLMLMGGGAGVLGFGFLRSRA